VAACVKHFGRLDILVTNAGGPPAGGFESFDAEGWRRATALVLARTVELAAAAVPHMRRGGWGRILCVTSITAKRPVDNLLLSNALRPAVAGFAHSLAREVAKDGITVNTILPGYTRTERTVELNVGPETVAEIPLGRLGEPREFAATAAFLVSERASYITGAAVPVDGGWLPRHVLIVPWREQSPCSPASGPTCDRAAGRHGRRLGLRRARARVLGRSLRGRPRAHRRRLLPANKSSALLERNGLDCWAIGAHLVGQAICDRIDERHRAILPAEVWGDGEPAGVQQRAAETDEGYGARSSPLRHHAGQRLHGIAGLAPALLVSAERLQRDRARLRAVRGKPGPPIIDVFDARVSGSALKCIRPRSPTTLSRPERRSTQSDAAKASAIKPRPQPLRTSQHLDAARFALEFADRIYHVHVKDSKLRLDGRRSILASHLNFGEEERRLGLRLTRGTATSTSKSSSVY